jgi:flagellar export protein FliJ
MTQFTYRLQPLLEQKEELKKEADREVSRREQELQTQLATLESLQRRVQELVEKRQHARQELMTKPGDKDPLTAADVLKRSEFIKVLGSEIREAESDVSAQRVVIETCESEVKEAKEQAAEAQREVEVLNKHREKQEQRFRREEEAKEEVALDEIGNVLYSTRRRPT